eukprot:gene7270-8043_t
MSYLPHLPVLSQVVVEKVAVAVEEERELLHTKKSSKRHLSSALSTALTIVRQQQQDQQEQEGVGSRTQARVLLLQFDKDRPQNYNALMNCIFSAQKMEVVVDALLCSSFDSHLLQQVCFLAEGLYVRHGDGGDLAAMLTTYFLADRKTRQLLSNPSQKMVDFKASCHCHQKPVEFAHMCSVCLSLLCTVPSDMCPVCETPLRIPHSTG